MIISSNSAMKKRMEKPTSRMSQKAKSESPELNVTIPKTIEHMPPNMTKRKAMVPIVRRVIVNVWSRSGLP